MMTDYRVTAQDILACAIEIIDQFGWERGAYPEHGPQPRCIRAAIRDAAEQLGCNDAPGSASAVYGAHRRVSEAIYGKPTVGGIMDWEYHTRTTTDKVREILHKAMDLPDKPTRGPKRVV
jgi:hypothetical protein